MKLKPAITRVKDDHVYAMKVGATDEPDLYGFLPDEKYKWLGVVQKTIVVRDGMSIHEWVAFTPAGFHTSAKTRVRAVEMLLNENGLYPVRMLQTIQPLF